MSKVIEVNNLVKSYGKTVAVDNISFEVEKGNLFAFLGTNGAGKSTTIDILSTLIQKDSGTVFIDGLELGKDDEQIRKKIGIVFQNSVLDELLTVRENLTVRGSFYGFPKNKLQERIREVSGITGCDEFLDKYYGKLSGGQKRRADIARALINQPTILFLDEPTTGLDPKTRASIWHTIQDMQKKMGMTVFLTTHYMEEAANADMVTIINKGKIIVQENPNVLKDNFTRDEIRIYALDTNIFEVLKEKQIPYKYDKEIVSIEVVDAQDTIAILSDLKEYIKSFEVIHGNLDDVFLNVIESEKRG